MLLVLNVFRRRDFIMAMGLKPIAMEKAAFILKNDFHNNLSAYLYV